MTYTRILRYGALVPLLGACLAGPAWSQAQPQPQPAPAQPAAAPQPPPIMPFEAALTKAATDLFSKAKLPEGTAKVPLVIDPLIDGVSGVESAATRDMERRLVAMLRKDFPRFEVLPFNAQNVQKQPIVLVGTFTAVNNAGQPAGPRDAYRICLALADLKSKTIVAKGTARAAPQKINHVPTPAYNDSPLMGTDASSQAYIKTCQGTPLGNAVDAGYTDKIVTAAVIADAIKAYDAGRYNQALDLYTRAKATPSGNQLRVYNGVYLSSLKLGRTKQADQAFAALVEEGLKSNALNVRFLFRPGSASFIANRAVNRQYPMWVRQIAGKAAAGNACMEVVGHTSATGPAAVNDRLSLLRAEAIRDRLAAAQKPLATRLVASGKGSSAMLIGTGRDDASDALDRRVEFKVLKCA